MLTNQKKNSNQVSHPFRLKLSALVIFLLIINKGVAQNLDAKLANEYFNKGDYQKAKDYFEKAIKSDGSVDQHYDRYLVTLDQLRLYKESDKFLKKLIKSNPDHYLYRVDYALLKKKMDSPEEGDKDIREMINQVKGSPYLVDDLATVLKKRQLVSDNINLYVTARVALKEKQRYCKELAVLYKFQREKAKMIDELLILLSVDESALEEVQNIMQMELAQTEDKDLLIKKLYEKIQSTNLGVYNELLVWLYIQKRDFNNAFIQERAIDKRENLRGRRLLELGEISVKNQDYEAAIRIFQYITDQYPNDYTFVKAKRSLIASKELLAKMTYPVDTVRIQSLIDDYTNLLKRTNQVSDRVEIQRSIGLLHAFYLHDITTALNILREAIETPRVNRNILAQCKLDLGDIYILNGEPWESTLLYYQVEKDFKDAPLGHLAKLKNAKLSYFTGDFELAKSHLDVLKLATTREIANDALDLGLLIKDNMALDTSGYALMQYAEAELFVYKKDYASALARLDSMEKVYGKHPLADEILFLKANVNKNVGRYDEAIRDLKRLVDEFSYDILTDDALFILAEMYDMNMKQPEEAMELYKRLLIEFPGSIYSAEARKRFRSLRGDRIN